MSRNDALAVTPALLTRMSSPPKRIRRLGDRAANRCGVGDVQLDHHGRTARPGDGGPHFLKAVGSPGRKRHPRAGLRQDAGEVAAEAAGGAGHQRRFAIKIEISCHAQSSSSQFRLLCG